MTISLARGTTCCDQPKRSPATCSAKSSGRGGSAQPDQERALGPDLVRAGAALLVVYLHACVPYLHNRMPGLVWPVFDGSSRIVDALFWAIELFIMPLFLVVAGYFAYRSWLSGGAAQLLASRARRLLLPLLAAAVILLPIDYYVWITGWVIEGQVEADRLWKLRIRGPASEHLLGLGHLWFLHYVFLYCAMLAAAGYVLRKLSAPEAKTERHLAAGRPTRVVVALGHYRLTARQAAITAIPIVACAVLFVAPEVVFGFQHAFLPVPTKWMYSGTFFFGGVAVAAFDPQWQSINRLAPRLLAGGAVCGLGAITLGQWSIQHSDSSTLAFNIGAFHRVLLAALTVSTAWAISLGAIGAANRFAPALAPHRRIVSLISYLAGASFWIYLVHHPLVALIHIDLKLVFPEMASVAKSFLSAAIAVGLSLGTHHIAVVYRRECRRRRSALPQEDSAEQNQQPELVKMAAVHPVRRRVA